MNVGIIGAGTMGSGIAQVAATAGSPDAAVWRVADHQLVLRLCVASYALVAALVDEFLFEYAILHYGLRK